MTDAIDYSLEKGWNLLQVASWWPVDTLPLDKYWQCRQTSDTLSPE